VAAGALLCFIPMAGEFVIPDLMGGSDTLMLGKVIWIEFFANRDWPAASAVAIALLATLAIPILLFERRSEQVLR
jgi:putrescine transport system permease protein